MYEYFRISAEDLGKDAKIPLVKLGTPARSSMKWRWRW